MTLTGTLLRIFGAAILLIAVQFASVAAKAHVGHSHGPDGHSIHSNGAAVGAVHTVADGPCKPNLTRKLSLPLKPSLPLGLGPSFRTQGAHFPVPMPA
jgi:hypothetical protein